VFSVFLRVSILHVHGAPLFSQLESVNHSGRGPSRTVLKGRYLSASGEEHEVITKAAQFFPCIVGFSVSVNIMTH